MSDSRSDSNDDDLVGRLIRTSGRGPTPPDGARERVYAAVRAEWQRNVAPPAARERASRPKFDWLGPFLKPGLAVAAAAAVAIGVGSFIGGAPEVGPIELASLGRTIGDVSVETPNGTRVGQPSAGLSLAAGTRLRTGAAGGAALTLSSGESVRVNVDTELVLASRVRVELMAGAVYVESARETEGGEPPQRDSIAVSTRYGDVRHVGTQYEVSVGDASLRIRVREGAVAIATGPQTLVGRAGEQIVVPAGGDAVTTVFAPTDPGWQWTEMLAVLPAAPAYPLTDVLEWVARQTGRDVEFGSADIELRTAALELNGLAGLTPREVIDVVRSTTDLDYRLTDASIVVD